MSVFYQKYRSKSHFSKKSELMMERLSDWTFDSRRFWDRAWPNWTHRLKPASLLYWMNPKELRDDRNKFDRSSNRNFHLYLHWSLDSQLSDSEIALQLILRVLCHIKSGLMSHVFCVIQWNRFKWTLIEPIQHIWADISLVCFHCSLSTKDLG
jgi:hypothetical protein